MINKMLINLFATVKTKIFPLLSLNKKIFNFNLFLRYLTLIFISSILIYFLTPKLINYNKKLDSIKYHLQNKYKIHLINFSTIDYHIFPKPRLVVKDSKITFSNQNIKNTAQSLELELKYLQLFEFDIKQSKKLKINKSKSLINIEHLNFFLNSINLLENKIYFEDSTISLINEGTTLINIDKIKFNNFDRNNLKLKGFIFKKKIEIYFKDRNKLIIKIPEIGSNINSVFNSNSNLSNFSANVRSKILNTNLQFDITKNKNLIISNSFMRNKKFLSSFDGKLILNPYFNFDLDLDFKKIDFLYLKNSNFIKNMYEFINENSQINGDITINFENKRINFKEIKKINLPMSIQNREIKVKDAKFEFDNFNFLMSGILSNNTGYRKFDFTLDININNKKKFLKKYGISKDEDNLPIKLDISGSLNLVSKKIYLKNILINKEYSVKKEKLNILNQEIQGKIINESLFGFFEKERISKFIKKIN